MGNLTVRDRSAGLFNYLLYAAFAFLVIQRAPTWLKQFKATGTRLPDFSVSLLDGETYHSSADHDARAIVFWATWCGPCTFELGRIQRMIDVGKIAPASVLAISSHEETTVLRKAVQDRGYTFTVASDLDGDVVRKLEIQSTPTIILKSANQTMDWITNGLSPTLELRLQRALANKPRTSM
jgi:peroxiredoxin